MRNFTQKRVDCSCGYSMVHPNLMAAEVIAGQHRSAGHDVETEYVEKEES